MCVCVCVCVHVYAGRSACVCLQDVYTEVGLLILCGVSLKTQWGQALFRWKLARRIPVSEFTSGNASSAPALSAFLLFETRGLKGVYSQE